MSQEHKSLCVTPPSEVYTRAVVATEEEFELPAEFIGQWITLQAQGEDVYFRIFLGTKGADSGQAIVIAANATITSQVIAHHADGAAYLPKNDRIDVDLSQLPVFNPELKAIKVLHISPAATSGAKLRFWRSSGPVS
jgi:hypothetical protein